MANFGVAEYTNIIILFLYEITVMTILVMHQENIVLDFQIENNSLVVFLVVRFKALEKLVELILKVKKMLKSCFFLQFYSQSQNFILRTFHREEMYP